MRPPAHVVDRIVANALAEDLEPLGDLTASLLDATATATLDIVARTSGVIAGQDCVVAAFAQVDPAIDVRVLVDDGGTFDPGTVVTRVTGRLQPILSAERTALNLLSHLSGVATVTAEAVAAVRSASATTTVLDTRKTTPGLRSLEKAAVRAGGGRNHRANLSDGILIKDNHLGGISITEAVARAKDRWPGRNVEVECDTLDQVHEAATAGATSVLLDNMTPSAAGEAARAARAIAPQILVEVSGGITVATAAAYAAEGVDLISIGALTHSAPTLDFGLDLSIDYQGGR
jgi:nicotinate-nucleotide pyrophosphorylase (carboxylating)